ncbi:hypothetical protein LCGC14_0615330 [marine sediment metagenome]|uniref:Uncharacterized protein n=1 Tax=marine sediment metagenome TaxID=412755 RepID=A0A0F9UEY1_9ZZZZ|nr:hypothetical protein [bacterium]
MGNADLIIIINGVKVIKILGTEYSGDGYDNAIKKAIEKYREYIINLTESAEFPKEIDSYIRKIEVYEFEELEEGK